MEIIQIKIKQKIKQTLILTKIIYVKTHQLIELKFL